MPESISVVIPVGPKPYHRQWLPECLSSLESQTRKPDRVIIVNDGGPPLYWLADLPYIYIDNEMRLGMVSSFNRGVAHAPGLAITLGSDDMLLPHALEDAAATWRRNKKMEAYYYFDVAYSDGRTQSIACHAAMVHSGWYKKIGGLPPESAVGAPDTMLISMIMAKRIKADLINIKSETPPYWYRMHDDTDTRKRGDQRMQTAITLVRDYLTEKGTVL